jgi:hypothetical protein
LVVSALILTLLAGTALIALLASGYADPPRAARLAIDLSSTDGLATNNGRTLIGSLRAVSFPITIEVTASSNSASAAWGLWVYAEDGRHFYQIRGDGYWSMAENGGWQPFIHIAPEENTLYLHIESSGSATFRINDEIAWQGSLPLHLLEWGVIASPDSAVHWRSIRLYGSE